MLRVPRLFAILLVLFLVTAACSAPDSDAVATASVPAAALLTSGGGAADEAPLDAEAAPERLAAVDVDEADAIAEEGDPTGVTAEEAPPTGALAIGIEGETCVEDALEAEPEVREQLDGILEESATAQEDGSEIYEMVEIIGPVLDCVSFGEAVAAVVVEDSGLAISNQSVACIDGAIEGNEQVILTLLTGTGEGDIDGTLIAAMVDCISVEELSQIMEIE